MGILKIDDVPPPLGAGGGHGDRPAHVGAGAASGAAGSGQATAGAAGVSAAEPPAPSAARASAAAGGGVPGATVTPGGQSVVPPHVAGSAPPPQAAGPSQAPPMPAPPSPYGPPASSMFDTSALTAPGPAAQTGPSAASPKEPAPPIEPDPVRTLELKPQIVEQLSTVFDPEIPVNIYELGLIYDIAVDKEGLAVIQMTLTAPGCPAAVTLPAEVQGKVKGIDGVSDARVDLVWEPPWDKDRMSDAAKLQLGIFD